MSAATPDAMPLHDGQSDFSLKESAAGRMVTAIPRARPEETIESVLSRLRGKVFDCADTVFVVGTDEKLQGVVRINALLADGERLISQVMEPRYISVRTDDDQETVAVLAMDYDMIAVPVVDEADRLVGAVPPEAIIEILRIEHMEDLQRLAGITRHEEDALSAIDAPLFNRYRRRLPWLLVGLGVSSLVTAVMAGFEHALAADVAVAFFVPALVYIAGAIGSQAVSVAVRGLSAGDVSAPRLLRDELIIGTAIGVTLGVVAYLPVYWTFDREALALAVGLAVALSGSFSAIVGFGLPLLFQKFGADPALGSGPICTVIQDVASLMIYFIVVTTIFI